LRQWAVGEFSLDEGVNLGIYVEVGNQLDEFQLARFDVRPDFFLQM
jgi:hypothetical protein